MTTTLSDLFDAVVELPDAAAHRRYERLVGLESVKERLLTQARILLRPSLLDRWAEKQHGRPLPILEVVRDRPPLFIFAGDVGTGKTTLAETIGDAIARRERGLARVTLMRLSLNARGSGTVGEMTTLITRAFAAVEEEAPPIGDDDPAGAVILLIDEADALAQSREASQMHHEDRAGVNALIRGIDSLAAERRPVIIILATNRLDALDPAIRRRAFDEISFARPDREQREFLLGALFEGSGLTRAEIAELADATGDCGDRNYGMTYSDMTTRLASAVVLEAFDSRKITYDLVARIVSTMLPSPPFLSQDLR